MSQLGSSQGPGQGPVQGQGQARESFLVMHDADRPWAIRAERVARIIQPSEWQGAPPLAVYSDLEGSEAPGAAARLIVVRCPSGERALRISSQLEVYLAEPAQVVPLPVLCRPSASDAVSVVGLVVDGNEIRFLIVEPTEI